MSSIPSCTIFLFNSCFFNLYVADGSWFNFQGIPFGHQSVGCYLALSSTFECGGGKFSFLKTCYVKGFLGFCLLSPVSLVLLSLDLSFLDFNGLIAVE